MNQTQVMLSFSVPELARLCIHGLNDQKVYTAKCDGLFYHAFLVKEKVVKQSTVFLVVSSTFLSVEIDWLKLIFEYRSMEKQSW